MLLHTTAGGKAQRVVLNFIYFFLNFDISLLPAEFAFARKRRTISSSSSENSLERVSKATPIDIENGAISESIFVSLGTTITFLRSFLSRSRWTYPAFSSLSIMAVTAPVVKPVNSESFPAVDGPPSRRKSRHSRSVECCPTLSAITLLNMTEFAVRKRICLFSSWVNCFLFGVDIGG